MAELESTILNGLTFSIFESVAAPKKKELAEQIKKYGGAVSYMISNSVTHLVVRDDDLKKTDNPKIKKAKDKKITLITEVALTKLIETKKKEASRSQPSSGLATPNKHAPRTPSKELATTNGKDTPTRAPSSPTKVKQSDSLVKASELNISVVPQSNPHKGPPTVTLLLPDHGAITGDFQVAVFGLGFTPNPKFRVKFGSVTSVSYEFHSSSSVICRIPATLVQAGEVLVAASNDGGRTYGFPARFKFIDAVFSTGITSPDVQMSLLSGQLLNLHRAIQNIQRMEVDLKNQLQAVAGVDIVALQKQYALDNDIEEDYSGEEQEDLLEDEEEPIEVPAAQRAKTTKKALLDREIRLFIASPFRDMQSERDLLVKMVIPKLRKMCMERDIVFSYVDLRWGVTDQQNESAATMLMCLREIERCNMFICSYGERYGWSISPEHESAANELLTRHFETAAKEFPWVDKFKDRSVTELELRMVLEKRFNGPEKNAWFYLRDPYFIEEVPDKDKHLYLSEGQISGKKLAKLKQFIQESDHPVKNYNRPTQMTELVFEDLKSCIEQKYPKDTTLSTLERERFRHEIYSRSLLRVYLPHEDSLMAVDKYISGAARSPYVISGPSGIGKSALLANWVTRHREHFPEDIVISHFVGASPNSATHTSMLYRIMAELHEILDLDETLPDPDTQGPTIVREFFKWLENTMIDKNPNKRRLIIVIDGLNKLDDRENARELIWFPQCFPKRVRVVVTTTPGTSMDVLKKRKCEVLEVPALTEGDRKSFLRLFLNLSSKKLTESQELKIAVAPQSAHPRFLQTLLEDICVVGAHEELEKRISHDLRAKNAAELYEIVLDRMEVDFDLRNKGVVNLFLSYIACSRRGLYLEQELKPLLAQKKINEEDWSDFFVTAEEQLLSSTGGLLSFVNEDIQKAVERKYLSDKDTARQYHEELANFFLKIEDLSQRKVDELPWQLEKAAMWDMLKTTLSNLAIFDKLWIPANKFDLLRYWRSIEKNSQFEAYQCYKTVIDLSQFPPGMIVGDLMFELGQCLLEMAKYNGAEEVYYKAIEYFQKASQRLNVAKVYVDLATLYNTRSNESEKSEKMLLQAQEVYEKEKGGDAAEVGLVLNKLGVVYTNTNQPKRALEVLARALRICESTLGVDHLQTGEVYYSLGCAHLSLRDLPEAERCLLRALKITEEQLGDGDPDVSNILNRIGTLYIEMDQFNDAESAFKRSLLIREKKLGEDHSRVAQTLKHMISLYEMQENYEDAILVGRRALNISKKIFGDSSLQVANIYMRLGVIFMVAERNDEAREVLRSALALKEKLSGKGSKAAEEVQHILDEIDKPKNVPPPPPPPGAPRPPPPMYVPPVQQVKPVQIDIPFGPGGVPPPPPPPPPGPKQVQVKVQEQAFNGGYLADLQNYSRSALKRAEQVVDKSDGKQAAITMLAQKKSKLKLKKATWTNDDDDMEMEVPKTRKPVLLQNKKK